MKSGVIGKCAYVFGPTAGSVCGKPEKATPHESQSKLTNAKALSGSMALVYDDSGSLTAQAARVAAAGAVVMVVGSYRAPYAEAVSLGLCGKGAIPAVAVSMRD